MDCPGLIYTTGFPGYHVFCQLFILQLLYILQIPLDIVQDPSWSEQPQFVDFEAESKNRESSTKLKHVIRVSGVEPEVFFTIQSTKKSSE